MNNQIEIERIKAKLELWNTKGFFWFLADLQDLKGEECHAGQDFNTLKRMYQQKLGELEKEERERVFKQTSMFAQQVKPKNDNK